MMLLSKRYKCQVIQLSETHLNIEKKRYVIPKGKSKKGDDSTIQESDDEDSIIDITDENPPQNTLVRKTG